MALDIVALDIVSFDSFGAMITSDIFISVFIDLTPYTTKPYTLNTLHLKHLN